MYIKLQSIHNVVPTQTTNVWHNADGNAKQALQSTVHKTTNNVNGRSKI